MAYYDGRVLQALGRAIRALSDNLRLLPRYLLSHGVVALFTALVVAAVSFKVAKDEMEVSARALEVMGPLGACAQQSLGIPDDAVLVPQARGDLKSRCRVVLRRTEP